ncbi:unnamed protein product, partial [Rotaria sp. Silwood1]
GAQYLQGEGNNQVFDICNQLGCLVDDQNKSELAESISDVCNQIVDNTGQENYSSSLDYFKSKQVYERVNEIVQDANLCQAVIDWLIKGEMDNNGASSLSDVSLGSYHEFEDSEGNDERQLGQQGFRSFIEYLRSSISEHKIQLNCEVTKGVLIYREKFWADDIYEMNILHANRNKSFLSLTLSEFLKKEKVDMNIAKAIMENINNYTIILNTSTPT